MKLEKINLIFIIILWILTIYAYANNKIQLHLLIMLSISFLLNIALYINYKNRK